MSRLIHIVLTDRPLTDLLDAFSSPDPTPGGGSAAALMGALGASLLAMVAGLPKTKTGAPEARAALDAARASLLSLRQRLVELVDRDAAAYDLVVAAYRRPKATDEEKAARAAAIQEALRVATEVPVETFRACAGVLREARAVAEYGNPSARTDAGVGIQTVGAAIQGALFNIEANIGSLTDQAVQDTLIRDVKALQHEVSADMRAAFEVSGIVDLMKRIAARFGFEHGRVHEPGTPEHTKQFALMAAESLVRLGSPEARRALDALAASQDEHVATQARAALLRL